MNPADDYVADFVAGISRLKVVRAHAVMQDIAAFERAGGTLDAAAKTFPQDADLSQMIEHAIADERPFAVVDGDGKRLGVIDRADLLRTVIEGTETS